MNRAHLLADLLAHLPLPQPARAELCRRMAAPGRAYHGPHHLALLWQRHRRLARGTALRAAATNRLLAAAIAYHDIVLVPGRTDNEARSAMLWRRVARRSRRFAARDIEAVADAIQATSDHLGAPVPRARRDAWRPWLLDLDLSPLGEPPPRFARNTADLRREAAGLDPARQEAGRVRFLAHMHAAPRIFRHPRIRAAFDPQARRNLARELQLAKGNAPC